MLNNTNECDQFILKLFIGRQQQFFLLGRQSLLNTSEKGMTSKKKSSFTPPSRVHLSEYNIKIFMDKSNRKSILLIKGRSQEHFLRDVY